MARAFVGNTPEVMIVGVEYDQDDGAMIRSGRIIPSAPGLVLKGKQRENINAKKVTDRMKMNGLLSALSSSKGDISK